MYLRLHQSGPYLVWKRFDWDTLDRLHTKGMIDDPKQKHTSVALMDDGVADAAAGGQRLFGGEAIMRRRVPDRARCSAWCSNRGISANVVAIEGSSIHRLRLPRRVVACSYASVPVAASRGTG